MQRLVFSAGFLILVLLAPAPLWSAATCPAIPGGESRLAELDVEARLAFIRRSMMAEESRVRSWTGAWQVTYGVLTGGQLGLIPILDPEMTPDLVVGATTSAIGLGSHLITPLALLSDQPLLEAKLTAADPAGDRCLLLAEAEALWMSSSDDQLFARGWLMHLANAGLAVAGGLILWLGYDRFESGLSGLASGLVVGELMFWTQPAGLEDHLADYRRADLTRFGVRDQFLSWAVAPLVVHGGGGASWILRF